MTILVTGATGYVGRRLAPRLAALGYRVRAMARDPRRLGTLQAAGIECVEGDVLEPETLEAALRGVSVAYYLVHSMHSGTDYAERDRQGARNFALACAAARVSRIVYLGGLGLRGPALSKHLSSRQEVGDVLRAGPTPVTELRAAIIIGAGSASFEIIRDLARRLPVMICPRWVRSRCEPIGLNQVLTYLTGVLTEPRTIGEVLEIGGGEVVTYQDLIRLAGAALGKKIRIIGIPVLSPRLSSYWLNLVTSVPMSVARPLVDGLRNDVVTTDHRIREWIPAARLLLSEIIKRAITEDRAGRPMARSTGVPGRRSDSRSGAGPILRNEQRRRANASAEALFAVVARIGGRTGWYYGNWLWQLRGTVDRALGGVGMRRGRRDPDSTAVGDPIDFWRIDELVPGRLLRLSAEMKVPGSATLEFEVLDHPNGGTMLAQRAVFEPRGAWGRLYWHALEPLHALLFRGMADGIVQAAEARQTARASS